MPPGTRQLTHVSLSSAVRPPEVSAVRDPRPIDDVLLAIAEVWARAPDLRLGQLLVNAIRPGEPCPELSGIEDAELVRRVQAEGRRMRAARAGSPGFEAEPTAEQWAEIDARILA